MNTYTLFKAVGGAAIGLLLVGCNRDAGAASLKAPVAAVSHAVPVHVAPVTYDDTALPVRVSGTLSRRTEAALSFKIGGVVDVVTVRAGEAVAAGQELARLQLAEIDAQVDQARSGLAKAQRDLARVERLESAAVATAENLQDARTQVEQAEAQVRIAEFNRLHAVIVAPQAGRILRRSAEPGEWVPSGRPVLSFAADGDGWLLRGGVADRDARRVAVGDGARVTWRDSEVVGRILQVGDAVDPATGMVPLEILLEQTPAGARSGSVAEAEVQPGPVAARPVIPASALLEATGRSATVFLVLPGQTVATRRTVEVEAMTGEVAYLRTLLPLDAAVVVVGAEYLSEGATVEVISR